MKGIGSGNGAKAPDHPGGQWALGRTRSYIQNYHQKSLFSNKLDPSLHAKKRERERANGIVESPMDLQKRQQRILEARELTDIARQNAERMMEVILEIADNPDLAPAQRLAAANMVIERAFGKAATTNFNINASVDAKPEELDDASLVRRINDGLKRLERAPKTVEGQAKPINIREYN